MKTLLRVAEVSEMLSISKSSVWRLTKSGILPQPLKISERTTAWRLSDIQDFINSRMGAIA